MDMRFYRGHVGASAALWSSFPEDANCEHKDSVHTGGDHGLKHSAPRRRENPTMVNAITFRSTPMFVVVVGGRKGGGC